jgi:hypothetical protein
MATTKINFNQIKGSMINAFDYMTANEVLYTSTFGAQGTIGDLKTSLDLAFAQVGKIVFCPAGLYNVTTNLAKPTCLGIKGETWNPTSGSVGTLFQFQSPVTVGFDIGGSGFHYFGGINIYGGSTSGATGLRLGYCGATQNLMNHALIEDVRIWSFPGTSVGMFMADMNYCDFRKIWINDCNTNIYASSTYTVGAGNSTVPTDINMYGITSLQSRSNNFVIKTLGANIYGLKIASSSGAAIVTGGLSDTGAKLNTDLKIYGMSLESNNTGSGSAYWALNFSADATNSGYNTINIYDVGHDSASDKLCKVDGDRCHAILHGPNIFGISWPADYFYATGAGNLVIDQFPGVLTNYSPLPALQSICTVATNGVISGPALRKVFTITSTGHAAVSGNAYYYLNANNVVLQIPQIGGTSNSATFTLTGLPTEISPTTAQEMLCNVQDNTGSFVPGIMVVNGSVITLYSTLGGAGWTASGTKTLVSQTITYLLP